HENIIASIRSVGASVQLITDGDVAGVIATTEPEITDIDIYIGQGGAPEGVLAAAALRCVGGQLQTRLVFRNDRERARAERFGITDFNRRYDLTDLASGDVVFSATGVTNGSMLEGVHVHRTYVTTQSSMAEAQTLANPVLSCTRRENGFAGYALDVDCSFAGRSWRARSFDEDAARGLELAGFAAPFAQLLAARGVTRDTVAEYLVP